MTEKYISMDKNKKTIPVLNPFVLFVHFPREQFCFETNDER